MGKTKIEWCDFTCNCHWGCNNGCPYCAARMTANRFGASIGRARARKQPEIYTHETISKMAFFEPVFLPDQLAQLKVSPKSKSKNPNLLIGSAVIFIDFMSDLFAPEHDPESVVAVLSKARSMPHCIFVLLTKRPQNLQRFSPFPSNCWVGQSLTGCECDLLDRIRYFSDTRASVRFISFEPLLTQPELKGTLVNRFGKWHKWTDVINWIIIGSETGNRKEKPPLSEVHKWAGEIIQAADEAGIPVFIKDNLKWPVKRQEWPLTNKEKG